MATKKTASSRKTATKTPPATPIAKNYLVYDPACGCSPAVVFAMDPKDAAKEFAEERGEDLGSELTHLHIVAVDDIPKYKFSSAEIVMTQVKK